MEPRVERLGLLGGTFDPPHEGHLALARAAYQTLNLDRILFLPVGEPSHKQTLTPAHHRLQMTERLAAGQPAYLVDPTDVQRPPPHYTVTLLPLIQKKYPQAALWLLLGEDALQDFPNWQQPAVILRYCRLGVMRRPGHEVDKVILEKTVPGVWAKVDWLQGTLQAISSTEIRQQAAADYHTISTHVPASVLAYIKRHQLYAESDSSGEASSDDSASSDGAKRRI